MKTLTTFSAVGSMAICAGIWRAWTGADALTRYFGEATNSAVFVDLIRIYCLGPSVLLLSLLITPFCTHSGKWMPLLLTVGIIGGAWGMWNSSFSAHLVGHALFNECGDTFSTQLNTFWGVGISAAVAILILYFLHVVFRKKTANKSSLPTGNSSTTSTPTALP